MRSGVMIGQPEAPGGLAAEARRAEQLGFDLLASGEHVFFHGPTSNAFLTLAAAAAVTERIRLLSALTILPLYPMALAAKMAATLDQISGDRFDLGVGVGGEYPPEFAASGVPVAGRGTRTDEALAVMLRLLAGEQVAAEGSFAPCRTCGWSRRPCSGRTRPSGWVAAGRLRCAGPAGSRTSGCPTWSARSRSRVPLPRRGRSPSRRAGPPGR